MCLVKHVISKIISRKYLEETRIHFCIKPKSQWPEKTATGFMVTWSLPVCEMHVLSNHYYMPSGTFSSSSHGQVSLKCSTAVILMTLNEKGIWKKRHGCVIALRNLPPRKMSCGRESLGISTRRWTTDVRRNSRFGKRQREKIATRREIFFCERQKS